MIQYLEWDSNFFRKKISSISVKRNTSPKNLIASLNTLFHNGCDCVYLIIPKKRNNLVKFCTQQKYFLADSRIILQKETRIAKKTNNTIKTHITKKHLPHLFEITDEISLKSRFYKDPKFRPYAKKLYRQWVENAIYHQYADKCFFTFESGIPTGTIMLKCKNNKLIIDLFGVHKDFRRRGIGTNLLNAAESWALEEKFNSVYVPTQQDNTIAVLVYQKYGFSYFEEVIIYHIWRHKYVENNN